MIFLSLGVCAQQESPDSTKVVEKALIEKTEEKDKKQKKAGFGDSLLSLGKGFLERLKYRFNLEAVEEKVEKTQEKFKKKEDKPGGN